MSIFIKVLSLFSEYLKEQRQVVTQTITYFDCEYIKLSHLLHIFSDSPECKNQNVKKCDSQKKN